LIFLVVGLILGAMQFSGTGDACVGVSKLPFFVAIAIFVVLLVLGIVVGKKMGRAIELP